MANRNKSNRKGGSNASILHFFSKAAPKRSAKSSKLNDKPIMSSSNDFSMTPLPSSSTHFNPNIPPSSSAATPTSISSEKSLELSVTGEVTIESSSLQQQQQQHDTSLISSSATPTANFHNNDSPLTPPTPPATHELENEGAETPPSPDSQASFTPETPPTPESEYYVGKKRRRRQPQDVMTTTETPQDLLDRHDDKCVNDDGTEIHLQNETLVTATTPSDGVSKSCTASKPSSYSATSSIKRRTCSNKKRSFNSYTTPKPQTQQQQPVQKKKKKSNQQQMFLDFGQSSFGKRTVCKICGMLRVHGVVEDDIEHAKVCKLYKEGVTCLGWKNERKVEEFGGGGGNFKTNDRILEVREGDALQHRRKVLDVKRIVDGELGFAVSSSGGGRNGDDVELEQDSLDGLTSYLYISNKRVVGLLLVKRIQRAYQVVVPESIISDESSPSFSISRSLKPSRALLGIHQIWVHSSHRKKGIASKLVTAARDHLIFGMMIPLELIAFSSPTMEGLRFAKSYLDMERPLVYDIN